MAVHVDADGRRSVHAYVLVGGSPAQIWEAIATGPGITSWHVPTSLVPPEGGIGSEVRVKPEAGTDSVATVTTWEPNSKFTIESHDLGENAPVVATEWSIERRSGGKFLVRVVRSMTASTAQWDQALESWEEGWPPSFDNLRDVLEQTGG